MLELDELSDPSLDALLEERELALELGAAECVPPELCDELMPADDEDDERRPPPVGVLDALEPPPLEAELVTLEEVLDDVTGSATTL